MALLFARMARSCLQAWSGPIRRLPVFPPVRPPAASLGTGLQHGSPPLQARFYGPKQWSKGGPRNKKKKKIPQRSLRTVMDRDVPKTPRIKRPLQFLHRALERWDVVGGYRFRAKRPHRRGHSYLYNSMQRRRKRRMIIANPTKHRKLKRLIPMYRHIRRGTLPKLSKFTEYEKEVVRHYRKMVGIKLPGEVRNSDEDSLMQKRFSD